MKKYIKKHIKQEKVIVKLLYKKGLLDEDFKSLGWESFKTGKMPRRLKKGLKYKYREYIPELFIFYTDYWGEGMETPVVETYLSNWWYDYCCKNNLLDENYYPTIKLFTKENFIKYLRSLPNKRSDSKINKLLKIHIY